MASGPGSPWDIYDEPQTEVTAPPSNDPWAVYDQPAAKPSSQPTAAPSQLPATPTPTPFMVPPVSPQFQPNPNLKKTPVVKLPGVHQVDISEIKKLANEWVDKQFEAGVPAQCANFVRHFYKKLGVSLGVSKRPMDWDQTKDLPQGAGYANSLSGQDIGESVEEDKLQPGDILFYENTYGDFPAGTVTHTGVYTGKGNILHRSTHNDEVREVPYKSIPNYKGAIRPRVNRVFSGSNREIVNTVLSGSGFSIQDQSIMRRMFGQESNYDHRATSHMGAIGLGQMMPETAAPYLAKYGYTSDDYLENPQVQAFISSQHMQTLLHKYDGDWARALAAYNGGNGAVNLAMKNGGWKPSSDPNSYYVQTRNYIANILDVSPDEAMEMVAKGTGPKANVQTPSEQAAADRDHFRKGFTAWNNAMFATAGKAADFAVSPLASGLMAESRKLDEARGVEANLFKDVIEGSKAVARGFLCGALELNDYQKKMRDSIPGGLIGKTAAYATPLGLPTFGSPLNFPDLIKGKTGKTLIEHLKPDTEYYAPVTAQIEQDYKVEGQQRGRQGGIPQNERGFFGWVADTARWMTPSPIRNRGWVNNPSRSPINTPDMEALAMEIPTLAGMAISAELLGPNVGILSGPKAAGAREVLGAPGDLVHRTFARLFPKQAASLGEEFFKNSAIWGSVGATQMGAQMAGERAAAGGSPQEVAGAALGGMFQGYVMGMGFPLVVPTIKGSAGRTFGAALSKAAEAYKKSPHRPALEKSFNDIVGRMDDASGGWFSSRIFQTIGEGVNRTRIASKEAARTNVVENFQALIGQFEQGKQQYAQTLQQKTAAVDQMLLQLKNLDGQVTAFEQRMPNVAVVAQRIGALQEELGLWNRAKAQELQAAGALNRGDNGPMQKFQAEVGSLLGVKDPAKFRSEASTRTKKIEQEIQQLINDEGYDAVTVQTYMEAKKAQNQLTEQSQAALQDPVYTNREVYAKDIDVMDHIINKLNRVKENVQNEYSGAEAAAQYWDPWFDKNFNQVAVELPPSLDASVKLEEVSSLLLQFDNSLASVVDAGLSFGQIGDRLSFEVTRVSRALMEANASGSKERANNLLHGMVSELVELKANEPKAPRPPAKSNFPEGEYDAVLKNWQRNEQAAHGRDLEIWNARVKVLERQISSMQESNSVLFGSVWSEPGKASKNLVNKAYSEALPEVERELIDSGVQGGFDQLDSMLNFREVSEKRVLRETRTQWSKQNKQEIESTRSAAEAAAAAARGKKGKPLSPGRQKAMVKKAVRAVRQAQLAKRDELTRLGKANGGYVEVEIPTSWLKQGELTPDEILGVETLNKNATVREKERAIFVGDIDPQNGSLQIIDGQKRVNEAVQKGSQSVRALVPKDVWEATLAGRLSDDTLSRITQSEQSVAGLLDLDGNPVKPSYGASIRQTVLLEAESWFESLNPVQREGMLMGEVANISEMFQNVETPSRARFTEIMGNTTPSSWMLELGTDMQELLMSNHLARRAMKDFMDYRHPSSLKEMFANASNRLKQYVHEDNLGRQIATSVSGKFKEGYYKALDVASDRVTNVGTHPGGPAGSKAAAAERKAILQREMVDALQQMPETNVPIQEFLRKYPEMREPLAVYFDMLRTLEQWKITSPELKSFFNEVGFAHVFPRLNDIVRQVSTREQQSTTNTRLASEMRRKYKTLAEAEKAYKEASAKVMNGNWKAKDPGTLDKREEMFINATPAKRMEVLGLDPADPKSAATAERVLLKLGLRDPIVDPTEIIRRQIQSTLYADSVRNLLSDLAQLPIPGLAALDPRTNKPYTVLSHFPKSVSDPNMHGSAPLVPTISRGGLRSAENTGFSGRSQKMVALDSPQFGLSSHATVEFNGKEIPASELYIHPDVADLIRTRILTGNEGRTQWTYLNEALRLGALVGSPVPHSINIATNHWGALAGHAMGTLMEDVFPVQKANMGSLHDPRLVARRGFNPSGVLGSGMTDLINVPRDTIGLYTAGNKVATNTHILIDATRHGVHMHTWNQMAKTATDQTIDFLRREASDLFTEDELTGFAGMMQDIMEKADTGEQAFAQFKNSMVTGSGGRSKAIAKALVNADYFMNKYGMFEPIRQAQIGAYAYWSAVHWKDIGQRLIDEGIPRNQALKIVKEEAANYVNLNSGVAPHYKDMEWARRAAYGDSKSPFGVIFSALTPGWLRAKVHALMSVMDPILDEQFNIPGHGKVENPLVGAAEHMGWDRRTMGEFSHVTSQAHKDYLRKQWSKQFAVQIAGSFAGLQVLSLMLHGATTMQMNPDNVKKWFAVRIGDRDYSWPFFGIFKDTVRMARGGASADMGDMLGVFTDQLNPVGRVAHNIRNNNAGMGQGQIYSPDKSPMAFADKGWDISKYILSQYFNLEDTTNLSMHPYPFAGFRGASNWDMPDWVASWMGFHPQPYNEPLSERSYLEGIMGFQRQKMQDYVRVDIERWARDGDREALDRALKLALKDGIPTHGDTKDVLKKLYPDGRYRMSPESVEQLIYKMLAPQAYALDKLDPAEKLWLFQRLERFRKEQGELVPYWAADRYRVDQKGKKE